MSIMKIKIAKIKEYWREIPSKLSYVLFGGVLLSSLLFAFLVFYYGDLGSTLENAVLLADAIKEGQLLHYYDYTIDHVTSYWAANYDLPIYIIFAVWNIPIIIARAAFGLSISSGWALLWCKGIVVFFTFGITILLFRTARLLEVSKEGSLFACLLFLSGLNVVAPVFILGQYDCISLFFMLLGLYYYLRKKKAFYLCFMIAVPLKMFALFLVLPLILLREKRIPFALLKTGLTCILWMAFKAMFLGDMGYKIAVGAQGQDGLAKLLSATEGLSPWPLCLFIGAFILICFYCYTIEWDESDLKFPVYVSFWVFASMMMLMSISDYWIILVAPFLTLCIVMNPEKLRINLILETISGIGYLLFAFIYKVYPYNFPDLIKKLVLPHIMDTRTPDRAAFGTVSNFFAAYGLDRFVHAFYTVFFVGMLLLVLINRPKTGKDDADDQTLWKKEAPLLWLRICAIIIMFGILLYANLAKINPPAIETVSSVKGNQSSNLLDQNVITQDIVFDEEIKLDELELYFVNPNSSRENMSSVVVQLVELKQGEVLFEKRIASNQIDSERACKIKLGGTPVEPGITYQIRLSGKDGVKGPKYYISPMNARMYKGNLPPLCVNGKTEREPLYFQIR